MHKISRNIAWQKILLGVEVFKPSFLRFYCHIKEGKNTYSYCITEFAAAVHGFFTLSYLQGSAISPGWCLNWDEVFIVQRTDELCKIISIFQTSTLLWCLQEFSLESCINEMQIHSCVTAQFHWYWSKFIKQNPSFSFLIKTYKLYWASCSSLFQFFIVYLLATEILCIFSFKNLQD